MLRTFRYKCVRLGSYMLLAGMLSACQQQTVEEKAKVNADNALKATTDAVKSVSEQVNKISRDSKDLLQNTQQELDDSLNEAEETLNEARENSGKLIAPATQEDPSQQGGEEKN